MNATCLHCHTRFEPNDVVEAFPFARRIAYDPAKLRYWVVCEQCGKWNLTPLEDDKRASAIEHFERWWRLSPAHYTTGGIGLGHYTHNVSVVRVGATTLPEFASWRYGGVIRRRQWREVGSLGGLAGVFVLTQAMGGMSTAAASLSLLGLILFHQFGPQAGPRPKKPICRVLLGDARRDLIRGEHVNQMELDRLSGELVLNTTHDGGAARLVGKEAIRVLAYALGRVNYFRARQKQISDAVTILSDAGGSEGLLHQVAQPIVGKPPGQLVSGLRKRQSIALEMAAREEMERVALNGEIALLKAEWREAEEIAAIASEWPKTIPSSRLSVV